jgi:rhodanese-related sulfurtransferase
MKRVNLAGAIGFVVVAAAYLVASLVTGHSAASHPPTELDAADRALDVYQATALLVEHQSSVAVVDVRPSAQFRAYHLPGARSAPAATPRRVLHLAGDRQAILLMAATDATAAKLAAGALDLEPGRKVHFVRGGAQSFYLTFELPVAAFTDQPAPFGYDASVATVRQFLAEGRTDRPRHVIDALTRLSSIAFTPSQLAGKKPPAAKKRKKIAGGCG